MGIAQQEDKSKYIPSVDIPIIEDTTRYLPIGCCLVVLEDNFQLDNALHHTHSEHSGKIMKGKEINFE